MTEREFSEKLIVKAKRILADWRFEPESVETRIQNPFGRICRILRSENSLFDH